MLLSPVMNADNDEIESWTEAGEVWAAVAAAAGDETFEAGRTVAKAKVMVTIRYRTDLDVRWRIRDRDLTYQIRSRTDVARLHVSLELACEEIQ